MGSCDTVPACYAQQIAANPVLCSSQPGCVRELIELHDKCEGGLRRECWDLGFRLVPFEGPPIDVPMAIAAFDRGCELRSDPCCNAASRLRAEPDTVDAQ